MFASRADLIPEPYIGELGTLVDAVPPFPVTEVDRIIAESYDGRRADQVFERFDRVPVAAASLGQVHRARLKGTGETVAVKVLRPGVERAVKRDLIAARKILSLVERYWEHPSLKRIRVVLDEFELRIAEEMDFRLEAEHAMEIGANFAGNTSVIVPKIYHELTRARVLVMEFISGTRIDRLDAATVDVPRVVATLVELYVQMMLVDGFFHADPHPGNVFLTDDHRIALLDLGMVGHITPQLQENLLQLLLAACLG